MREYYFVHERRLKISMDSVLNQTLSKLTIKQKKTWEKKSKKNHYVEGSYPLHVFWKTASLVNVN